MSLNTSHQIHDQLRFLNEIEKLKVVYRRNRTIEPARFENSAEHSWHIALMALVLHEYANDQTLDLFKVLKMLLIHDLVEIYAGDTWLYDQVATATQVEKEALAAQQLFALLPDPQASEFMLLWQEFEARNTSESAYAAAIDAFQPLMNHLLTGIVNPGELPPTQQEVLVRKRYIETGSSLLWHMAQTIIQQSMAQGLYREDV